MFIGLQAAALAPQLYYAYVGVAQMVHQLESERRAYEYMLGRFTQAGNGRMVRRLEAAPVTMTAGRRPGTSECATGPCIVWAWARRMT